MDWKLFLLLVLAGTAGAVVGMLLVRVLRRRSK
jgi:uncharacterized membrane protein YfcA